MKCWLSLHGGEILTTLFFLIMNVSAAAFQPQGMMLTPATTTNPFAVVASSRSRHPRRSLGTRTTTTSTQLKALSNREREIRRKISALKKEGRLGKKKDGLLDDEDDDEDIYASKIQKKLGKAKTKMLGFDATESDDDEEEDEEEEHDAPVEDTPATAEARTARIGSLPPKPEQVEEEPDIVMATAETTATTATQKKPLIDPTLYESNEDDDDDEEELSEEELVDLVAEKMMERRAEEQRQERETLKRNARERLAQLQAERQQAEANGNDGGELKKTTSGIGGSWKKNATAEADVYKPKTGSWGAFPRPRDISKTYGGGRRVGPGYSNEAAVARSTAATRDRLRQYREKVGIIVQSEQDHAEEIDQALKIAGYAMQRGVYNSAVSTLEKVTKYCSSNSKVGGKVFLELAMAYEASGRAEEALVVYRTLSSCRIEEIKYDAKRLLYGLEAMKFMRDEVGSKEFSRKKAKNTFIDTTGLANIASNFDDVYNTAWIDMDRGFYKSLTKNVVRSTREARQILLRATGAGEIDRTRIVQALRSVSRRFDEALEEEIRNRPDENEEEGEPTGAVIDGVPIIGTKRRTDEQMPSASIMDLDEFVLAGGHQMKENLNGEWRLQLLADKQGDGVKFFNTTYSWQKLDLDSSTFTSEGRSTAFLNVEQSGRVSFDEDKRVLSRDQIEVGGGGGVLAGILGATSSGAPGAVRTAQQVMSVDSAILLTRRDSVSAKDDGKEFFAVWRRIDSEEGAEGEGRAAMEMNV